MHENTEKIVARDTEATRIPSGETITLAAGTRVIITQALGGSYTVATDQGLARIKDEDADALGLEPTVKAPEPATRTAGGPVEDKAVWDQLRTCYDPEIPVNIVDLGLVYDCVITERPAHGAKVEVKMTVRRSPPRRAPKCSAYPVSAKRTCSWCGIRRGIRR
jgi:hypothetical protein